MSKGSPAAAKQGTADPLIKEKTYEQLHPKRGIATGPVKGRLGESRAQMRTGGK
jgi:hypothetical protein